MNLSIKLAADVLLGGGVIAYPTEGVFGLGCMPDDLNAIARLLDIKQRAVEKGLILVAADAPQLAGWVAAEDLQRLPPADPAHPTTWIAAPGPRVEPLLRGAHSSIAVRITTHALVAALCRAVDSPITSTSANISGRPIVRNKIALRARFRGLVDYLLPGDCGSSVGPSEIRSLNNGRVLRASNA